MEARRKGPKVTPSSSSSLPKSNSPKMENALKGLEDLKDWKTEVRFSDMHFDIWTMIV